jgi:hypothetical protein
MQPSMKGRNSISEGDASKAENGDRANQKENDWQRQTSANLPLGSDDAPSQTLNDSPGLS